MKTKIMFLTMAYCIICCNSGLWAQIQSKKSLEGKYVREETLVISGVEVVETLSDDGMSIIKRPYQWFEGTAADKNKRTAIEKAQRVAFNNISRFVNNAIMQVSNGSATSCNNDTLDKFVSHWKQFSKSVIRGCEPFGDVVVEYEPKSKIYTVTCKVALRGDRLQEMLKQHKERVPIIVYTEDVEIYKQLNTTIVSTIQINH